MSVTEQDRERARELWQELGKPAAAEATPEQLLAFLRQCSDTVGLDYAARLIDARRASVRCFEADHDGLIDELRYTRTALAEANLKLGGVFKWIGDDE